MNGKKILTYVAGVLLFLVCLFLTDRGLYYLINRMETDMYSKNDFELRFEEYMQGKSFNTLIFGTSRTYEGIHPIYFEKYLGVKAFKEAFQGKGPKYNYYFYKLYKKYAGVPKVVVYGVDYFIYNVTSDPKWMSRFKLEEETPAFDWFAAPLLLVHNKKKIDNFHNNLLMELGKKPATEVNKDRFKDIIDVQVYTGIMQQGDLLKAEYTRRHHRQVFMTPPGVEGEYFDKLLKELDRDGVTVILTGIPSFYGTYKTNFQHNAFLLQLKSFLRIYKRLYILNFNRPGKFPLEDKAYFNDGGYGQTNSHLSQLGSQKFCEMLLKSIADHYK